MKKSSKHHRSLLEICAVLFQVTNIDLQVMRGQDMAENVVDVWSKLYPTDSMDKIVADVWSKLYPTNNMDKIVCDWWYGQFISKWFYGRTYPFYPTDNIAENIALVWSKLYLTKMVKIIFDRWYGRNCLYPIDGRTEIVSDWWYDPFIKDKKNLKCHYSLLHSRVVFLVTNSNIHFMLCHLFLRINIPELKILHTSIKLLVRVSVFVDSVVYLLEYYRSGRAW